MTNVLVLGVNGRDRPFRDRPVSEANGSDTLPNIAN